MELWVSHPVTIANDVCPAACSLCAAFCMGAECADYGVQFALVEFAAALCCPLFSLVARRAEDRLCGSMQSLLNVKAVDALDRAG